MQYFFHYKPFCIFLIYFFLYQSKKQSWFNKSEIKLKFYTWYYKNYYKLFSKCFSLKRHDFFSWIFSFPTGSLLHWCTNDNVFITLWFLFQKSQFEEEKKKMFHTLYFAMKKSVFFQNKCLALNYSLVNIRFSTVNISTFFAGNYFFLLFIWIPLQIAGLNSR